MSTPSQNYKLDWQGLSLSVTYCPDWMPALNDTEQGLVVHLEVRSDDRGPLPITETGYRSRFLSAADVDAAGGPVAYVRASLEYAAKDPAWEERKQLSLF